jgi:hypothetical protein
VSPTEFISQNKGQEWILYGGCNRRMAM